MLVWNYYGGFAVGQIADGGSHKWIGRVIEWARMEAEKTREKFNTKNTLKLCRKLKF